MKKLVASLALASLGLAAASSAEARPREFLHDMNSPMWQLESDREVGSDEGSSRRGAPRARRSARASVDVGSGSTSGLGPRPRQWCGWWMRSQLGGGPHLNVAWNWRNYGSSGSPRVGAVVVWRHHVGMIVGQASNGQWIVKSGNDGGRVRERARSIAGAVIRV